ncbi:MAG: hypothetical protein U0264_02645 [Candidatus Kapaibacterium sp.]
MKKRTPIRMSVNNVFLYGAFLCSVVITACSPDQFFLNANRESHGTYIFCEKLASIDSVERTADNAMIIYDGGKVALSSDLNTDFIADYTVSVDEGQGVRFRFRTTKHDLPDGRELAFVYSTTGARVEAAGVTIATLDTVRAALHTPERVIISNWSNRYTIQVGCSIVYYGTSSLPTTEFSFAETLPGSTVSLSGIDFIPLRRAREINTPQARAEREVW